MSVLISSSFYFLNHFPFSFILTCFDNYVQILRDLHDDSANESVMLKIINEVCIKHKKILNKPQGRWFQHPTLMLDVTCLILLQKPLPYGLYPLSSGFGVVAIVRLRYCNMINILHILRSFNVVTNFTTFYRQTKICITNGNFFVFTRSLITSFYRIE